MASILVLCGGDNLERRVSLASGDAVSLGLAEAGHKVVKIDTALPEQIFRADEPILKGTIGPTPPDEVKSAHMTRKGWAMLNTTISMLDIDMVFPILHGSWGEDGRIQALLELLGLPYLGSGMLSSQVCMNKPLTKETAVRSGIACADGFIVPAESELNNALKICQEKYHYPVVVKPSNSGSAVNVFIVQNEQELINGLENIWNDGEVPLVEQYIPGRELTVTVLENKSLPVVEIVPKTTFYDYTRKYTAGETEYLCPAPIDDEIAVNVREMSAKVFAALGCRHIARVDWRLSPDNMLYFLEVNTIPGMTALSLVPMAASETGIDFPNLMDKFVNMVLNDSN
ncbi:MAG: D-alanine--D-alanine ligase [Candidatus Electryonea clarkiae]|nr:D-alanine--D-alanine ligase [Candidatus Electryonea clarkiae]